jgi:hypothetical protein
VQPQRPLPPPQRQARRSRPDVVVPPPDDGHKEIENDIMAFCDNHPDEPFCGKLGKWLREHGDQR